MRLLKKSIKSFSTDLETTKSLKEILIEFKIKKDQKAKFYEKREMKFRYKVNDDDTKVSHSFTFIVEDVLKFLDEAIERKQAKYLFSVSKKFIKHEGGDVFSFLKEKNFGVLPTDLFLKSLGVSNKILLDIFKKLTKSANLSLDHKLIYFDHEGNRQKPDDTPRQKVRKHQRIIINHGF